MLSTPETLLKCQMPDCNGYLGENTFPMQTGCNSWSPCRACNICGRVHSLEGTLMFSRAGHSPFLHGGEINLVLEPVKFVIGVSYKTTSWMWTSIDGADGKLEVDTEFIFDGMDEETFCFHGQGGKNYRLHRGDVNFVEPI